MDLRETVDAYWAWWLDRHGANHSPRRTPGSGFDDDSLLSPNFFEWDLDVLKWQFRLLAPTQMKNRTHTTPPRPLEAGDYAEWSLGAELPFPGERIADIDESGVNALQDIFGFSDSDKTSIWRDDFKRINSAFAGQMGKASDITKEMRKHLGEGPLFASSFLAIARVYLMTSDMETNVRDVQVRMEKLREIDAAADKLRSSIDNIRGKVGISPSMENLVSVFVGRLEGLAVGVANVHSLGGGDPRHEKSAEEADYPRQFNGVELLELIEKELEYAVIDQRACEDLFASNVDVPGDLKPGSTAPIVYRVFESVSEMISAHKGVRRGRRQMAQRVFDEWGFEIDLENARRARNR